MKKRIMTLLLTAAIAAGLTGCSGKENASAGSDSVLQEGSTRQATAEAEPEAPKKNAKVTIEGTKFMVNGSELWINGVNTPWQSWNDFCGNMDVAAWENTFALLQKDNINCTRIWINCNGTGVVDVTSAGMVDEVNEAHWTDLDKLFALAEKYEVYVMPTLMSFDHFKDNNTGKQNWRNLVKSNAGCDDYAEKYCAEFAKRYGSCDWILGVDLMNEPDWVYENEECGQLPWENLTYFFAKCSQAIHENSDLLVTVGLGMPKYNSDKYQGNMISDERLCEASGSDKSYLDFYSPHYYSWERSSFGFPFTSTPEEYGIGTDKPCVVGETSNDDKAFKMTCEEFYKSAYEKGWNGVMVWMEYRTDGSSGCDELWYRYDLTQAATNAMNDLIPEKIHPWNDAEQSSEAA